MLSDWIFDTLGKGATFEKLLELQSFIFGYGLRGTAFLARIKTVKSSIEAFVNNPITGIIVKPIPSDHNFILGFGQHSYFLDTFALYGILIGVLNLYLVIQPFYIRMVNRNLLGLNLAILASMLLLFSINNTTASIGFGVFFIYPVIFDWLNTLIQKNRRKLI